MRRPSFTQFGLRHLALLILLVASVLAWVAALRQQAAREAQALRVVKRMGGIYDAAPTPAWKDFLAGGPVHPQLSVRLCELGAYEQWGPYGPGGSLVRLHAWEAAHFDELGQALQHLPGMTSLSFEGSRLGGHAQELIPDSMRLEYLCLERTGIRPREFAVLRRVPNLQRLSLRRTGTNDAALGYVEELHQLQFLDLSSTDITDAGLPHVSRLEHLTLLRLENTRVGDDGLRSLQHLRGLDELDLGLTSVTADSLDLLARMQVSRRLVVPHAWDERDVARLQASLPATCEVSRSPYPLSTRTKARPPGLGGDWHHRFSHLLRLAIERRQKVNCLLESERL